MSVRVAVVMDPIARIHFKKDTTLAMLWAMRDRGWTMSYIEPQNLFIDQGRPWAYQQALTVYNDPEHFYTLGEREAAPLAEQDVILMRQDPPFDMNYIYATYLLEMAEAEGVLVVNRPQALRDFNEKLHALRFPQFCPPHVVSNDGQRLREFHQHHGDIILKPLDGMGGASIFRLRADDPNVSVVIETLTHQGQQWVMAQRFIPEIALGDKRILLVDGEPVAYALARIPAAGETRGNLAAGGRGVAQPLSPRDLEIAHTIGPWVRAQGLLFVGLDVIGDYLTEINITSPTCVREIDEQKGTQIAVQLMDVIANRLEAQRA